MRVPYGVGFVTYLPLVQQASPLLWKTSPTIAAGDAKLISDNLPLTTLSTKTRSFTSGGTYVLKPGDTVTGHTSSATALVTGLRLTSGSFAGGDAAGILFLEQDTGTFQSEDLDVGSNLNVATIAGALSAAGVFAEVATGLCGFAVSAAHAQCKQGTLVIRDAAGAEWCDTGDNFETEDHPLAMYPNGCILQDNIAGTTGQTTLNIRLSGQPSITPQVDFFFRIVAGTGIHQCGYIRAYLTAGGHFDLTPYKALVTTLDATSIIKVYEDARGVSEIMAVNAHELIDSGVGSKLVGGSV